MAKDEKVRQRYYQLTWLDLVGGGDPSMPLVLEKGQLLASDCYTVRFQVFYDPETDMAYTILGDGDSIESAAETLCQYGKKL